MNILYRSLIFFCGDRHNAVFRSFLHNFCPGVQHNPINIWDINYMDNFNSISHHKQIWRMVLYIALINLQTFLKILLYRHTTKTFLGQIVIGLQNVRVASSNPVPSLSTKFELLSLSLASILKISTFGTFAKNIFYALISNLSTKLMSKIVVSSKK